MSVVSSRRFRGSTVPYGFLQSLHLAATVDQLPLDGFCIPITTSGRDVAQSLHLHPQRPGVILLRDQKFVGMISRRRFWEQMSRPYSLELFSQRPIQHLYQFIQSKPLRLPGSTLIVDAAWQALQRSPDHLYEPLIIELEPDSYRLLDIHHLLIADSYIHQLTIQLLQESSQQLAQANEKFKTLATRDGLTGISNRRQFDESLLLLWTMATDHQHPITLLLMDVDFFKAFNDHYGHLAGDDALRQVAQTIQQTVQDPNAVVARYGGEEFAVILPQCDRDRAIAITQQIQAHIKALAIPHAHSLVAPYITFSIGIGTLAVHPQAQTIPQHLIAAADNALYHAKQQGRDRYCVDSLSPEYTHGIPHSS
ncbi:diguanylate cyclase [Spirulina major CS-329]|uniref:diguanylate cyclase domain-containing protein n=1 Tax=Spirulina TaxID=1154 RepID=UPI00232D6833|nr:MULTISPECIES: diguanylate cyclase [Spirulina]MDB9494428.1 diguanylate cyclase [Spirulina subsalsa CS-330]MDB9505262.1 diguanylate cyclase [Spirulina major CS-329]